MPDFFGKIKELMDKNRIPIGLKAGFYYPDFWGRDSLISALGLCISQEEEFMNLARKCIETCLKYQKSNGQVPNKISPDGKKVDFGEGGCVDASLWLPIACWFYAKTSGDSNWLKKNMRKIERSVKWVLNLDVNNDWLIETHEGSDWMDCLLRSGRVLYDNVLLYAALRFVDRIREEIGMKQAFKSIAEKVKENINLLLWLSEDNLEKVRRLYGFTGIEKDYEIAFREGEKGYYLAELGFRKYDARFDVFANVLALLFGVANEEKKKRVFDAFESFEVDKPYPVKVLVPPIAKNDLFRCFYFRETELPFLQEPGNFHNGGIWPFVGGFYVALLKKEKLEWKSVFDKLVEANSLADWRFSEWLNDKGIPSGSPYQTWSACTLLFAWKFENFDISFE
jgi:glycogen debranching enzyme